MALARLISCAIAAWLVAGCAHTEGTAEPAAAAEPEVTVLRERVLRLERRLSDLDAQVALLSEKVADAPRESVSLGAAPAYAPSPTSYAPPPSSQTWSGYEPVEPAYDARRGWQNDAGMRSIDLGPGPPRSAPVELPPEEEETDLRADEPPLAEAVSARSSTTTTTLAMRSDPVEQPSTDAQGQYEHARGRMLEGRYLEAVASFKDLLAQHAQHDLADNALYWIGVCHLERGEPRLAIDTWKTLPLRFPSSAKMPDSLYGMALAHEEMGEPVLAETLYGQLLQQYPKAEKVGEAKKALKRLRGSPDAPR